MRVNHGYLCVMLKNSGGGCRNSRTLSGVPFQCVSHLIVPTILLLGVFI